MSKALRKASLYACLIFKFSTPRSAQLPPNSLFVPIFQCCSAAPLASKCILHAVDSCERPGSNRPLAEWIKSRSMATGFAPSQMLPIDRRLAVRLARQYPSQAADYDTGSKALETRKSHLVTTFPFSFLLWSFRCTVLPVIASSSVGHSLLLSGDCLRSLEQAPSGLAFSPAHLQVTRPPLKGHPKLG